MQSRACFVGDHLLYSYYLNMRFRGDIVGRDYMPVTLRGERVDFTKCDLVDGMESLVVKDGRKKILKNYENVQ